MLALGLLSDDAQTFAAVRMVMDQGIEVVGLRFISPFGRYKAGSRNSASDLAGRLGIRLVAVPNCHDYLDIIREPRFGRGAGMNPCIDCRIYLLRKAKAIAEEMGAKFVFTGESLAPGPSGQGLDTLELIDQQAGMEGKVLRPLSARSLPETEAERMGWIDHRALASFPERRGRAASAQDPGLPDHRCHAEGCLLADPNFAARLRDFLTHGDGSLTLKDVGLLKLGRHFRVEGHKAVIGRDRRENARLLALASDELIVLCPVAVPGPVGLLDHEGTESLGTMASMVARYCDGGGKKVRLKVSSRFGGGILEAEPMPLTEVREYLVDRRTAERDPLPRSESASL